MSELLPKYAQIVIKLVHLDRTLSLLVMAVYALSTTRPHKDASIFQTCSGLLGTLFYALSNVVSDNPDHNSTP